MTIAKDLRDRIETAANALYEEGGRGGFPTVSAVRARAGADMNATSLVMREWRRLQTGQAAQVAVEVPEKVRAASTQAIAALWSEAQAIANASLAAAQKSWDAEQADAESMRADLSAAFDSKAEELASAQTAMAALQTALTEAEGREASMRTQLVGAEKTAEMSHARALEIERRADALAEQLKHTQAEAAQERGRLVGEHAETREKLNAANADRDRLQNELARASAKSEADAQRFAEQQERSKQEVSQLQERLTKADANEKAAQEVAMAAREEAATMRGELKALQSMK